MSINQKQVHAQQPNVQQQKPEVLRNTALLVLAGAVYNYFDGQVKFGTGMQQGQAFSFDFETPRKVTADDLPAIEKIAADLIKQSVAIVEDKVSLSAAQQLLVDQPYQSELLSAKASDGKVSLVRLRLSEIESEGESKIDGNEVVDQKDKVEGEDLREVIVKEKVINNVKAASKSPREMILLAGGPAFASTSELDPGAIKLLAVSGAYWQGDANNPMLQRITGTAFATPAELTDYLKQLEEAQQRDHRVLGKQLDLFSHSEDVGAGLVLWHPKGAMVRYLAERFSQDAQLKNGYEWVYSPHIGRENLWMTSGHLDFYKESMYAPIEIDNERYYLKPMSCPFHLEVFRSKPRSYRELPKRYAEFGTVYRYELSGALQGLTRVRGFTQDDAHIICTEEQAREEIQRVLRFSLYVLRTFGLHKFKAYISTKPEDKGIGSDDEWQKATDVLRSAVEQENLPYQYDEGGGAFYSPKIDIKVTDSLGREWQLSTIQFDFNLAERFDLSYIGKDNLPHRPFVIHRALFGSLERFLGLLIEHYGGAFPLWLAPVQATIIPVADRHADYAHEVAHKLKLHGLRVEVEDSSDRLGAKIRNAKLGKVPFALVVGDKELNQAAISVRTREGEDRGAMSIPAFLESLQAEVAKAVPIIIE